MFGLHDGETSGVIALITDYDVVATAEYDDSGSATDFILRGVPTSDASGRKSLALILGPHGFDLDSSDYAAAATFTSEYGMSFGWKGQIVLIPERPPTGE